MASTKKKRTGGRRKLATMMAHKSTPPPRPPRPHRCRPGTVALREIKKYQSSSELLIPKAPFERLVREASQDCLPMNYSKFQKETYLALQTASEDYLVEMFNLANKIMLKTNKSTLKPIHLQLVRMVRGEEEIKTNNLHSN